MKENRPEERDGISRKRVINWNVRMENELQGLLGRGGRAWRLSHGAHRHSMTACEHEEHTVDKEGVQ